MPNNRPMSAILPTRWTAATIGAIRAGPPSPGGWSRARDASVPEGLLARGMLEADGIPVVTKGEGEGPYRMGPVHLWVPEEFEVQARLLLEGIRPGGEARTVERRADGHTRTAARP